MSEENVNPPNQEAEAPKRRGRPPKAKTEETAPAKTTSSQSEEAPKRRGRPPKAKAEESGESKPAPTAKPVKKDNTPANTENKKTESAPASPSSPSPKPESKANNTASSGTKTENSSSKPETNKAEGSDNKNSANAKSESSNDGQHNKPRHNHGNKPRHNNNNNNRNSSNNNKNRNKNGRHNNNNGGGYRQINRQLQEEEEAAYANMEVDPDLNMQHLLAMSMPELTIMADELDIEAVGAIGKQELVYTIIKAKAQEKGIYLGGGVLEVIKDGYGFLRLPEYNYIPSPEDIYLSPSQVRRFSLRTGDTLIGVIRPAREKEKFSAMIRVDVVNGEDPIKKRSTIPFESLTADFPKDRLIMETSVDKISMRVLDLITPLGAGQRALIVAPPRTGKTVLMQDIANAISANNPNHQLIVLLIDERPEEVTDMKRTVRGEVVSSTFDEPPNRHVQVAEMVVEKAKRMVEHGKDVVILLDSITRLARAYNTVQPHSGKILSGGVDANALHKPKRFFGAARRVQEGGSLTIIATALIDTGSKMDEVIFEEFKGTGNAEIVLDRAMIDKRIFPAINIDKSGTRKEELLLHPDEKDKMWRLRRALGNMNSIEAMQVLLNGVKKTKSNIEFLMTMQF